MKCPVCGNEIRVTKKLICKNCGFDDIRVEFVNDEERIFWETYVVKPCRYSFAQNSALRAEIAELKEELKAFASNGVVTAKVRTTTNAQTMPQLDMVEGWNYDDPIAHPNSASCYHNVYETTVELTNIKASITSGRKGTIEFVAKRVGKKVGWKGHHEVGFCWRVKDRNNIIVLAGNWSNSNLNLGDAIAGKIELNNVLEGYSIDFSDYR